MGEKIKQVLMGRDGMSAEDAEEVIETAVMEMQEAVAAGDCWLLEELCAEHFGLEPDYLDELWDRLM